MLDEPEPGGRSPIEAAISAPAGEGQLSSAVGDYLKAIWLLASGEAVATGAIARELGVTAPSVTNMLGKMRDLGLVSYEPYRGAALTEVGRKEALRLIRRHRLLETFMILELGFGWDEVHGEAELMEHVVSDTFTERLARHLGEPEFDPHGDPIPRADGSLPSAPEAPLAGISAGERFRVHRVMSQDSEVLVYLTGLSIAPGAELKLLSVEPGGNLLKLERLGGEQAEGRPPTTFALSRKMAALVLGMVL